MGFLALGAFSVSPSSGFASVARSAPADPGAALFAGQAPLRARIRGHRGRLPPYVVKCSNCHLTGNQPVVPGAIAPRLDRALLLDDRPRRGGPPSAYDEPKFCRLLRTGVDPAFILVAREMPVYELRDAQCSRLWRFLTKS